MPRSPSRLAFLPEAETDIADIAAHNPDHADRIVEKIADWQDKIEWGRVPQTHQTYLSDSPMEFNFYRERVGNSGYRVIYEISEDEMTVVAVLPKSEQTYDLEALGRRASE
jgi:mRNA interferase RelE/StbE